MSLFRCCWFFYFPSFSLPSPRVPPPHVSRLTPGEREVWASPYTHRGRRSVIPLIRRCPALPSTALLPHSPTPTPTPILTQHSFPTPTRLFITAFTRKHDRTRDELLKRKCVCPLHLFAVIFKSEGKVCDWFYM